MNKANVHTKCGHLFMNEKTEERAPVFPELHKATLQKTEIFKAVSDTRKNSEQIEGKPWLGRVKKGLRGWKWMGARRQRLRS